MLTIAKPGAIRKLPGGHALFAFELHRFQTKPRGFAARNENIRFIMRPYTKQFAAGLVPDGTFSAPLN